MSAVVCGKRSFFEEIPTPSSPVSGSPPVSKKLRCSSATSPVRFSYSPPTLINQLQALFPDVENELLKKALEESGNDLDVAVETLQGLHLGYAVGDSASATAVNAGLEQGSASTVSDAVFVDDPQFGKNLPADGSEWVELLVKEMMRATSVDDARFRATRVLESLEKSISARAGAEAAQNFLRENTMLKEQIEAFLRDNTILKRAVSIQHERQKEFDDKSQEVQHLKQLVAQYQEQIRTLEVNNYALTLHLQQAQQSNSMPGRFHPDVF